MSRPVASAHFGYSHLHRRRGKEKLVEVRLRLEEYAHDSLRLTYLMPSKAHVNYAKGLPVEVRYGWAGSTTDVVYGYVHHTQIEDRIGNPRLLHVFVVGASYRFNEIGTRSYVNKTLPQIASDVARRNKFSLTMGTDQHLAISHVAQHGKSDFALLVSQAKAHGYVFYVRNTDAVLVPRRVSNCAGRTPTFFFDRTTYHLRGAVTEFAHNLLETTDDHDPVSAGVSFSGRRLRARQTYLKGCNPVPRAPFHRINRTVVRNLDEAMHAATAAAELNRFTVTATATTSGDPRVRQASTVRMAGLANEDNGLWYVTNVDHVIDVVALRYTMELGLAKDALGATTEDQDVVTPDGRVIAVEGCSVPLTTNASDAAPETLYEPAAHCAPLDDETPFATSAPRVNSLCAPTVVVHRKQPTRHAAHKPANTHKHAESAWVWTWVWRARRFKMRRVTC